MTISMSVVAVWLFLAVSFAAQDYDFRIRFGTANSCNVTTLPASGGSLGNLAVSRNGTRISVGFPPAFSNLGAVYVYEKPDGSAPGSWGNPIRLGQSLISTAFTNFGAGTTISRDGNNIATGAWQENNNIGAVYTFHRDSTTGWDVNGVRVSDPLLTGDATFGYSVGISSGESPTLVIGGPDDRQENGSVWVFVATTSPSTWVQEIKLVPNISDNSQLGQSVAVSDDGNTIAAGCYQVDATLSGGVFIWFRTQGVWTLQAEKLQGSGRLDLQGSSALSLSNDGNILAVGAPGSSSSGAEISSVYIFTRDGNGIWTQEAALRALRGTPVLGQTPLLLSLGASVQLSDQGDLLITSGEAVNTFLPSISDNEGAFWIFKRGADHTWEQYDVLLTQKIRGAVAYSPVTDVVISADITLLHFTTFTGISNNIAANDSTCVAGPGGSFYKVSCVTQQYWVSSSADCQTPSGPFDFIPSWGCFESQANPGVFLHIYCARCGLGQEEDVTGFCSDCSPGTVRSAYQPSQCQECPVGKFRQNSSLPCADCPSGKFNLKSGTDYCQGEVSAVLGENICGVAPLVPSPVPLSTPIGLTTSVSLDISYDGLTLSVGQPNLYGSTGAVEIYYRDPFSYVWEFAQTLIADPENPSISDQGYSCSISGDGQTVAIGAPLDYALKGSTYIFHRGPDNTWAQQGGRLFGTTQSLVTQGIAVDLSYDGNTLAISPYQGDTFWIFVRDANTAAWSQEAALTFPEGPVNQEKQVVALSHDGNTVIFASQVANGNRGAIWVFVRTYTSGGSGHSPIPVWNQQGPTITDPTYILGFCASLSGDGNTIATGSPTQDKVLLYSRDANGHWGTPTLIQASDDQSGDFFFGHDVTLSPDGTIMVIGASMRNSQQGGVYYFTQKSGGPWVQSETVLVGTTGKNQGYLARVSADGNIVLSLSTSGWIWTFGVPSVFAVSEGGSLDCLPQNNGSLRVSCDTDEYWLYNTSDCSKNSVRKSPIVTDACVSIDDNPLFNNYFLQIHCAHCTPGRYLNTSGACPACEGGKFQDEGRATACKECKAGSFSTPGMSTCTACDVGRFSTGGNSSCAACAVATYQDATGQGACKPCSAGTSQNETGQSQCKTCDAGRYAQGPKQSSCTACEIGKFQSSPNSIQCFLCPLGRFQSAQEGLVCSECDRGTFQNQTGQIDCTVCAAGYFQNCGAQTQCNVCEPGTYQNVTQQTSCKVCETGKFQSQQNQVNCNVCSAGRYQSQTGQMVCLDCPTNTFSNVSGASFCYVCASGKHTSGPASTQCKAIFLTAITFRHRVKVGSTFYQATNDNLSVIVNASVAPKTPAPGGVVTFSYLVGNQFTFIANATVQSGVATSPLTLNQFSGLEVIKADYSGFGDDAPSSATVLSFFYTWPKNGNFLISNNFAVVGGTVTYYGTGGQWTRANAGGYAQFSGWTKAAKSRQCVTIAKVSDGGAGHTTYSTMGVLAVNELTGANKPTKITKLVILDTTGKAAGKGKVIATFCP